MKHKSKARQKKLFYFMRRLAEDKKKWKEFRAYLQSPLLGGKPKEVDLLDQLRKVLHDSGERAEEKLCRKLYLDRSVPEKRKLGNLRTRLSRLLSYYFDFEAFLMYREDEALKWRYVVNKANQNHWDEYFINLYEQAEKEIEKCPHQEEYFLHKMDLADQMDLYLSRQEKDPDDQQNRYQEELQALNTMYAIYLLKLACNLHNHHLLRRTSIFQSIPGLQQVLNRIHQNRKEEEPLVLMYEGILHALRTPTKKEPYFNLKALLLQYSDRYDQAEVRLLFQHATNCCTHRFNHYKALGNDVDSRIFQKELLKLYDLQLDKGLIFVYHKEVPYLDHGDFKNIVVHFSIQGEFVWVERFIRQYSPRILKNLRSVAQNFAYGILYYHQKKYEEAAPLINLVRQELKDSNDRHYALSVKGYFLRILYERQLYDDCEREAGNIAKSIHRNTYVSAINQSRYIEFCNHLRHLCRIIATPKSERRHAIDQFRQKIITGPPIISRAWLLRKLEEV